MTVITEVDEWFIEAGSDGKWVPVTTKMRSREEAVEHLEWYRMTALPSTSHRLVRETTVVTRTVEDA
ncbi:hypothetical protein [Streptomyces sp. 5-10]|uniref:hypothetical protein n=1 Tax=Streptomyces sp. 5-10 TaxID=878925 RepID=UPI00168AD9D4|nr:hypothetical protein [Streptomyces sp. 5-10]MBD3004813.1 hypothetical protein [Streptomyces sp. 5-10]